jgi:long-subunit fatty acid transport protein
MRNSKEVIRLAAAAAMACAVLPSSAWGFGIELPENGAAAFGRGGAFTARASDPSAVMHNVAGIMALPGLQITLSSNVGRFEHCFQRTGNYESARDAALRSEGTRFEPAPGSDPLYQSGNVPYPRICNDPAVSLAPMILGTYRINRMFSIGFGVFAPSTTGSGQNYPDTVVARDTMTGMSFNAPSPARNLLFRKNLLVLHPVVALAVQPTPWLRFGLGVEPSFARFQFGLHVNADRSAPQSPVSDVAINLDGSGFFMAGSLSTQVLPTSFLSFGANFHYNFGIDASGTANNIASPYTPAPAGNIASTFAINSMKVNLPWTLRVGARYNLPRAGRPTQNDGTGTYDPMTDDVFDLEANFTYEATSNLADTALVNSGNIQIDATGGTVPAPASITIRSALSDVVGFRLGGDFNIIPGTLAVRVGGSYETGGASPLATSIHLPAYAGGTINAGVSYRWRWLTISAGYGHFFFQDFDASTGVRAVTVPSPQFNTNNTGCVDQPAGTFPGTAGAQTCTINRGTYTAHMNSGSIQFTGRF